MNTQSNIIVNGSFLAEFVESIPIPDQKYVVQTLPTSRATLIGEFIEEASSLQESKEFTILLKDGRSIAVRGEYVKRILPINNNEHDYYGIMSRRGNDEEILAIFDSSILLGIFHGRVLLGHFSESKI